MRLSSCSWLAIYTGRPVSLAEAGLINQVGLGDTETLADLLYLGEKVPAWDWGFSEGKPF